jgi:hypothetical protein
MTIHTTSLEISKKLKEAGWVKQTDAFWFEQSNDYVLNLHDMQFGVPSISRNEEKKEKEVGKTFSTLLLDDKQTLAVSIQNKLISMINSGKAIEGYTRNAFNIFYAPTISELLEELPKYFNVPPRDSWTGHPNTSCLYFIFRHNVWEIGYRQTIEEDVSSEIEIEHESLEDGLSLLWLELKEKGLIK